DVGLVNDRHVPAALLPGTLEGQAAEALGALLGDDLDGLSRVLADPVLDARIEIFGVLPVEDDVYVLVREVEPRQAQGGPDVGVQIELLAQRHVDRAEPRPDGRREWPLQS